MSNLIAIPKQAVSEVTRKEGLAIHRLSSSRLGLVFPTIALLSGFISFFAFPWGTETDAYGLAMGGASLIYFSWSMILASRLGFVERAFGGFDRMHMWHRLFSMLAILTMWLHGMAENTVLNPVNLLGSEAAELGYNMAELAQNMVVILAIISIFRLLPYKIWKLSHKLFIVPFALGSFHFLTSDNTFEILSPWGLYFSALVALGLIAFSYRLLVVDTGATFRRFYVSKIGREISGAVTLTMRPTRKGFRKIRPGQFVFVAIDSLGREVHPFSIAAIGSDGSIGVQIAQAGDWTTRLAIVGEGDKVRVSPPLGQLELNQDSAESRLWVAGGSGVAPFLAGESVLEDGKPTTMIYSFRTEATAIGLAQLRRWVERYPNFSLVEVNTSVRSRLSASDLSSVMPKASGYVVACGPDQLVDNVRKAAKKSGAKFEFELYDFRLAYDLRTPIEKILEFIQQRFGVKTSKIQDFVRSA